MKTALYFSDSGLIDRITGKQIDNKTAFYHFVGVVQKSDKTYQAGVTIGEGRHSNLFHNLNRFVKKQKDPEISREVRALKQGRIL